MNVKAFATYTAVFVAGALALFGLNALSTNSTPTGQPAAESSSAPITSEMATPEAETTPIEHSAEQPNVGEQPATTSTAVVTAIGDLQRNSFVTVRGTVERVTDEDEFLIADSSGSVRVWTANSFFTVDPGESVVVQGFVDDDVLLEIYAQEITRADGTVVTIGSYSG